MVSSAEPRPWASRQPLPGLLLPEGAAVAQEPQRGGHLKLGLNGGATTDSLDPATYSGAVLFVIGRTWGDTLVEIRSRDRRSRCRRWPNPGSLPPTPTSGPSRSARA